MANGTILLSPKHKALLGFSTLTLPVLIVCSSKIKKVIGKKTFKNCVSVLLSFTMLYSLYSQLNHISIVATLGKKVVLMRIAFLNEIWLFIFKTGTFCYDYWLFPLIQTVSLTLPDFVLSFLKTIVFQFITLYYQVSFFFSTLLSSLSAKLSSQLNKFLLFALNYRFILLLIVALLRFLVNSIKVVALLLCASSPFVLLHQHFSSIELSKKTMNDFYKNFFIKRIEEFNNLDSFVDKGYLILTYLIALGAIYNTLRGFTDILMSSFYKYSLKK